MRYLYLIVLGVLLPLCSCDNQYFKVKRDYNRELSEKYQLTIPEPKFFGKQFLDHVIDTLQYDIESSFHSNPFHNLLFLDLDEDICVSPFIESIVERYNRVVFNHYVGCEVQSFYYLNDPKENDSFTFKVNVKLSEDEYSLVCPDVSFHRLVQQGIHYINTLDNTKADSAKIVDFSKLLSSMPYVTKEYITDEQLNHYRESYWRWYDKTQYVPDIEILQRTRADIDSTGYVYKRSNEIVRKRISEDSLSFDARCIYAIELSHDEEFDNSIDFLADVIEDGRYSKYLYEVWLNWRAKVQIDYFGMSSTSVIPHFYYDFARQRILNSVLRHIQLFPNDMFAKCLAEEICFETPLQREGSIMGNQSLSDASSLKTYYFLPPTVLGYDYWQ